MDVVIKINNGSSVSEMEMKGASDKSEAAIIAGFFGQMGTVVQPEPIKLSADPIVRSEGKKLATGFVKSPEIKIKEPIKSAEEITKAVNDSFDNMIEKALRPERTRRLPLVGQESRSAFPVSETAKVAKAEEPEHWKTGIKVDEDGTKRYKCHYVCGCGSKGRRYIPLDFDFVYCRDCESELDVYPAAESVGTDGIPDRDGFGNFFVAGEPTS